MGYQRGDQNLRPAQRHHEARAGDNDCLALMETLDDVLPMTDTLQATLPRRRLFSFWQILMQG